ncbi:CXXC zinc finger domain protein [Aphelenchoides bicaudatus]|nr:CXXC zinc finger domain protein [Aphelenchoides bicaudatus]
MTADTSSRRQSPLAQSATPPSAQNDSGDSEMAAKAQQPPVTHVAPQQMPPTTSAYLIQPGVPAPAGGQFPFPGAFVPNHLIHQQPQQKLSPAFQPAYTAAAAFVPPAQQFGPSTTPQQKVGSPKRNESILNSMCNRSQRCGVCKGCTNSACGQCNFCHDSPQFGGPGVKKQSCLERRCHRVLENKLQRDAPSFRARRGCGQCEDCRVPNCNACLVCFDRKYFENRYIPGAMCARKRCNHAVLLDNSTRMRPLMKKRGRDDDSYSNGSPKPAKRPSPAEEYQPRAVQQVQPQVPVQPPTNGNGALTQRLLQPMITTQPQMLQQPRTEFPLYGAGMNFPSNGFQSPSAMDPNANRLFQPTLQAAPPNGMCLFPTGTAFLPATNPQPNFYFIPQPLQPTAIHPVGKDIKEDTGNNEDPYQPPSYNQDTNGTVVLQAL